MTDFYKELNLDRSKGTEELKEELSKQENIWKQREIYNPEKSATVIALIAQARLIFATDASRRAYDQELVESQRNPETTDTEKARKEALYRWTEQARLYSANGQYDLAKVAIENAVSLSNDIYDNELYKMAATIYFQNNDLDIAMTYINKAIVAAPDVNVSSHYLLKGFIYDGQAVAGERGNRIYNVPYCRSEGRKMYMLAISMAKRNNNAADLARAYGALAYSLYFYEPTDKLKAKEYADLTISNGGDSSGLAKQVFQAISKERVLERQKIKERKEKERKIQEERKMRELADVYNEALRLSNTHTLKNLLKAKELFQYLSNHAFRDSTQKIHETEKKIRNWGGMDY